VNDSAGVARFDEQGGKLEQFLLYRQIGTGDESRYFVDDFDCCRVEGPVFIESVNPIFDRRKIMVLLGIGRGARDEFGSRPNFGNEGVDLVSHHEKLPEISQRPCRHTSALMPVATALAMTARKYVIEFALRAAS
jgi:hypothetical protein